jgi:hypothetical protein
VKQLDAVVAAIDSLAYRRARPAVAVESGDGRGGEGGPRRDPLPAAGYLKLIG